MSHAPHEQADKQTKFSESSVFQYPPLPAGVDGLRVLTVEPGQFSDPLTASLIPIAFGDKPSYAALSYTWDHSHDDSANLPTSPNQNGFQASDVSWQDRSGEYSTSISETLASRRKEQPTIILNNSPFGIGRNLCLALLHLRSPSEPLKLWVDAICINQMDEIERNKQVAIMSFIYRRATSVVAWLGLRQYNEGPGIFPKMFIEWRAGQARELASYLLPERFDLLRRSPEPDQSTFNRIVSSSYWSRLWIVQELCIPRLVIFAYGSSIWTYSDVLKWRMLQATRNQRATRLSIDIPLDALNRLLNARESRYADAMRLENLIDNFASSKCSKLQDKIYGLLGLANDVNTTSGNDGPADPSHEFVNSLNMQQDPLPEPLRGIGIFKIDYSCSLYEIWVNTVKFAFFRARPLQSNLHCIPGAEHGDGSRHTNTMSIVHRHERSLSVVRTASVVQEALGGSLNEDFRRHVPSTVKIRSDPCIRAVGYLSSEIVQVGPDEGLLFKSVQAYQNWSKGLSDYYDQPEDLEALRRTVEAYMEKIITYGQVDMDRIEKIHNPEIMAWRVGHRRPNCSKIGFETAWNYSNAENVTHQQRPRICIGTNRVIALIPSAAQAGDIIIQFWECGAAVVMRPIPLDPSSPVASFILIGRADVADHLNSDGSILRDMHMENSLGYVFDLEAKNFQASGPVFIDLDWRTLQLITACIDISRNPSRNS